MRKIQGFTLIELLVVISIIGILMSLLFPAVNGAMNAAKKAKAKNDVVQIVTAVKAFETEYGRVPTVDPGKDEYFWTQANNNNLFNALRGQGLDKTQNPRDITFIEIKAAKGKPLKDGVGTDGIFYDPWGTPYAVKIDSKYDHKMKYYEVMVGSAIAISAGKNTNFEDPDQKNDDLYSFQ